MLVTDYEYFAKDVKGIVLKDKGNANNLVNFDHYVIRKSQICRLWKLISKA